MRAVLTVLTLLCALLGGAGSAHAETRLALVIGNAEYERTTWRLANPGRDADAMAGTLQGLGFTVTTVKDANRSDLADAISEFGRAVKRAGPETIAFFYYAGHAAEHDGVNYLVPISSDARTSDQLRFDSPALTFLLDDMGKAGNAVNIVVLDACRDMPLPDGTRLRSSAGTGGLAKTEAPNVLIAYATEPGRTAEDGVGDNSRFTAALVDKLVRAPHEPLSLLLEDIRIEVTNSTAGAQRPLYSNGLGVPRFALKEAPLSTPRPPASSPRTDPAEAARIAELEARIRELEAAPKPPARETAPTVTSPRPTPQPPAPMASGRAPLYGYSRDGKSIVDGASVTQATPAGTVFKDCADCPEMIVIPAGEFRRGSEDGDSDEKPVRTVSIAAKFAVSRYEVTRGQYAAFDAATGRADGDQCYAQSAPGKDDGGSQAGKSWRDPSFTQGDDHPVVCVDWSDATVFAAWTNDRAGGRGYRLLSEAEFEYANRAGTTERYATGSDDPATLCRLGNVGDRQAKATFTGWTTADCDDGHVYTAPVGRYAANAFGVFDLTGNVWEWVEDCYRGSYETAPTDGSAVRGDSPGTDECWRRVLRGGSWDSNPQALRSAYRDWNTSSVRSDDVGFRLARTVSP